MIDLIYSNRNVPFTPKRAIIELPMTLRCPTGFTKWQWGWHIGIKAESYRGTLLWISTKQLSCIMRLVSVVTRVQETFFFSSILMSNHFLFTSLNPINLFCTLASRFWIFTLLTDTYVYWHRQTSQNNFHSNLWERLFFCSSFVISYVWALPFMEESCVHLQMKSDMPCTQLVTYGWLTFSNIRMHERIKSAFLEAILSSEN